MTRMRRLLLAAAVAGTITGTTLAIAPPASADLACAWVDPNGVCISNPGLPRLPRLPRVPL